MDVRELPTFIVFKVPEGSPNFPLVALDDLRLKLRLLQRKHTCRHRERVEMMHSFMRRHSPFYASRHSG